MRLVLACLCIFVLSATNALAQFDTATVVGTVRDTSGSVVPSAKVTLTSVETGIAVVKTSSGDGNYEFAAVKPGLYVVTAEKTGFAIALVDNVQVQVGARLRVDLQMPVGQLTEKVEVTAASAAHRDRLEPARPGDHRRADARPSADLPRVLGAGAADHRRQARRSSLTTGNTPREGAFNVNGLRSTFNNFLIDGVDNNAYGTSNQGFSNQVMQPPPDAIGEFRVVTNNMSAEYGRAAGATINVNYRSGTNQFHGDGWEFFRDTALNAAGFFKPPTGKPPLRPQSVRRRHRRPDRPEQARSSSAITRACGRRGRPPAFATIATPQQRQGILSVDIRDPRTGVVYPAGTPIPMTAFARKVLGGVAGYEPRRQPRTTTRSCRSSPATPTRPAAKSTCRLTPTLVAVRPLRLPQPRRPTISRTSRCRPAAPATATSTRATSSSCSASTWTPTGRSLLEARLRLVVDAGGQESAGARVRQRIRPVRAPGSADRRAHRRRAADAADQRLFGSRTPGDEPAVAVPDRLQPEGQLHVDGRGALASRAATSSSGSTPKCRTSTRSTAATPTTASSRDRRAPPRPTSTTSPTSCSACARSTRSAASSSPICAGTCSSPTCRTTGARRSRLTLNLGVRYEYSTPYWEKDNILTNFDPATNTMVFAKDGSIADRALVNPDRNNFGPRLGFAYTLTPGTVIRGGYGVSYVHFSRAGGGDLLPHQRARRSSTRSSTRPSRLRRRSCRRSRDIRRDSPIRRSSTR